MEDEAVVVVVNVNGDWNGQVLHIYTTSTVEVSCFHSTRRLDTMCLIPLAWNSLLFSNRPGSMFYLMTGTNACS